MIPDNVAFYVTEKEVNLSNPPDRFRDAFNSYAIQYKYKYATLVLDWDISHEKRNGLYYYYAKPYGSRPLLKSKTKSKVAV